MISNKILENLKNASFIRAMFEEGEKLRKIYGADKIYDFTLGNPDGEPPQSVDAAIKKYTSGSYNGIHHYMNNAGYTDVREKISQEYSKETGLTMNFNNVIMTCGAAGGLNIALKTILNPDEEVIVFAPFFPEYKFYTDNHGGKIVIVKTGSSTFQPNVNELKNHINAKTKAIIINTPNNPTGVVYSEECLKNIAALIESKEKELGTTIFVLSDEPYSKLVYDGAKVPSILSIFKNSMIINSFSKSLALPGERIGYIVVSPKIENVEILIDGLIFSNRTLGYVNAPSLFQKVIADTFTDSVNTDIYCERRDLLYNHLIKLGFECIKPQGAFYLFPKSPLPDDVEFKTIALKYNIVVVPGSGFGFPGYFRLAYCVSTETIKNSLPAFEALAKEVFGNK